MLFEMAIMPFLDAEIMPLPIRAIMPKLCRCFRPKYSRCSRFTPLICMGRHNPGIMNRHNRTDQEHNPISPTFCPTSNPGRSRFLLYSPSNCIKSSSDRGSGGWEKLRESWRRRFASSKNIPTAKQSPDWPCRRRH